MRRSSISSSDKRPLPGGFPWALTATIGVLAAVELGIRSADPEDVIPYDLGATQYESVVCHVDAFAPADVCFVGASRTREGIVIPEVQRACDKALAQPITVANYATAGQRAGRGNAVVTYLIKKGHPRLIVCGASPRILHGWTLGVEEIALFWDIGDWWQRFLAAPDRHISLLPIVIRNEVSKHYLTLKYRRKASVLVRDANRAIAWSDRVSFSVKDVLRGAPSPCPIRGDLTRWQRFQPDRSLLTDPVPEKRVRRFVDRLLINGEYPMPQRNVDLLADTIRLCRENGAEVIFFELPLSDILQEHLPPNLAEKSRAKIQRLCDAHGVRFFTLERLGLTFAEADFVEQSHLNYHGGLRLTRALLERAIIPCLQRLETQIPNGHMGGNGNR